MKVTPFTPFHRVLGARMAPFASFEMPISYRGINEEHLCVRNKAGVFDVSHMGEFILKGPGALPLIQRLTTNDASRLNAGRAQYSCLTNDQGGIVDDLLVYCLEESQSYMLVVNAGNIDKDWAWIRDHNSGKAELHDISPRTCLLAVQGPLATRIVQCLTDIPLKELAYYTFRKGRVAGIEQVLVSATGYTGSGGVEIYFEDRGSDAERIWMALFEAGEPLGLQPIGLGARDTLRLEMGFCLYGHDIDEGTSPLEAGLGWITKFSKDFTARGILEQQKREGLTRRLVGFELLEKGVPRQDYPITDEAGLVIGRVTSGTQSPSLGKPIGLGYVKTPYSALGQEIRVEVRGRLLRALVSQVPFLH